MTPKFFRLRFYEDEASDLGPPNKALQRKEILALLAPEIGLR